MKGWGKILKNPQESMSQNCSVSNASKSINNQKSLLKKCPFSVRKMNSFTMHSEVFFFPPCQTLKAKSHIKMLKFLSTWVKLLRRWILRSVLSNRVTRSAAYLTINTPVVTLRSIVKMCLYVGMCTWDQVPSRTVEASSRVE